VECVNVKRGVNGKNPGALRYDPTGLSTFEVLYKQYPCVISFKVCFVPPKAPGVVGQLVSVSNESETTTLGVIGTGTFTPWEGVPEIGANHWSVSETIPDTRGLLKQLCAGVKF